MAAGIPKRLYGPAYVDLTDELVYTVPAGRRAVVRHIKYNNGTGGAVALTVSFGADAAGTRIFDGYSVAAGAALDHYCYYVLEAAETIRAHASADDTTEITIDGDEYILSLA
jgi:hypothetical protein